MYKIYFSFPGFVFLSMCVQYHTSIQAMAYPKEVYASKSIMVVLSLEVLPMPKVMQHDIIM